MADDYSNDSGTSGEVLGQSVTGTLETAGDSDWFRISLTAGTAYSIALNGASTQAGTLADPYVYLYNSSGLLLASNDDGTGVGLFNSLLTYTPGTSDTYYIGARSYRDQGTGTYQLSVTSAPPRTDDEPADNASTTRSVAVGGTVGGELEVAGDADWYSVLLTPGTRYSFALSGASGAGGTLADPFVYLYNASGQVLASNDDGIGVARFDSLLAYTTQGTGTTPETYYVVARSYRDQGTGTYQLNVTSAPGATDDEPAASIYTDGLANVGVPVTGTLEVAGDADWYAVNLTAGTEYSIALSGSASGQGTLGDPHVYLYDREGQLLRSNDDGTGVARLDSLLTYTPQGAQGTSEFYFVAARSYRDQGIGTYQLSVTQTQRPPDDEPTASVNTQKTAQVGQTSTGTLESAGDADWFHVLLTAGKTYNIQLRGVDSGDGTLADPLMYLYDWEGTQITHNDDAVGRNSTIVYVASYGTAGTVVSYYVAARSYRDQGAGTYELDVTEVTTPTAAMPQQEAASGYDLQLIGMAPLMDMP